MNPAEDNGDDKKPDDGHMSADNPIFAREAGRDEEAGGAPPVENATKAASSQQQEQQQQLGEDTERMLRKIYACEYCLLFLVIVLASLMLASLILLLHKMPYEPLFWLYVFCMIFFWIFAVMLVVLWGKVHTYRGEADSIRSFLWAQTRKRSWDAVRLFLFVAALIVTFSTMMLLLSYVLIESFHPTGGLQLRRLAGVTDTTAKFFIRDPSLGDQTLVGVEYRLNASADPFVASVNKALITSASDYSSFVEITGLLPATAYEWRFESSTSSAPQTTTYSFKTNPVPGTPSKFSMYFGSCYLNNFPNFQQAPGFDYVAELKPDLFTFIGDFIYSDIPFFRSDDKDTYNGLYRQSFKNPGVQRVLQSTPNYQMWDDHEVRNNYPDVVPSNIKVGPGSYDNAIAYAWMQYMGGGNPNATVPSASEFRRHYFDFDYGDTAIALVDTRSFRSHASVAEGPGKTFLGDVQKQWLKDWLVAKNTTARFKLIMSPMGWSANLRDTTDSWGGYDTERQELFAFIRDNHIEGVLFFSGDSHFAYAVEIGALKTPKQSGMYEFSASPISAFDSTLGGFMNLVGAADPWDKPATFEDRILFSTQSSQGAISLLGMVYVDTTLPVPEVRVELLDARTRVFSMTFNATMLRPWEA